MARIKGTNATFDPEFRFLLDLDPTLEGWRAWAAEYWVVAPKSTSNMQSGLIAFLVTYLHGQGLHTLPPEKFLARDRTLPNPDVALGLALISEQAAQYKHDAVSDFLDWILREKLSVAVADGLRVVPPHLANPFPRRSIKKKGKTADLRFTHVLLLDPKLEDWRSLATEWLKDQKSSVSGRRDALDAFLVHYIHGQNLERNYERFLLRTTEKPDFAQVFVAAKRKGTQTLRARDVVSNNTVAYFLDWVLANKLGDPNTGEWDRSRFHNPVQRLTTAGLPTSNQSDKASLSIRYIRELRGMLTEGRNFRDWTWAQQAMEDGKNGGDWFVVDPQLIDPNDSDCVARQRAATWYEIENKGYPTEVWELWSPVRAMALYLKLELPLRTFQCQSASNFDQQTAPKFDQANQPIFLRCLNR